MLTNPGTLLVLKLKCTSDSYDLYAVLEAFGNAKTLRNVRILFNFINLRILVIFIEIQIDLYSVSLHEQDNSSRFGKWINVHFDRKGTVAGGCCIPRTFLIDSFF
jgi:hypothetical protein